jgi:hypothetical protein
MRARALTWVGACALVVLAARALAYQLAPQPTLAGATLEQAVGGPRLVVTAVVALVGALATAGTAVWLATVAVRERHLLAGGPRPEPVRVVRVLGCAVLLFAASCAVFDGLESYLHWRAGLGFHGLHCLVGPVHRDALPLLGALSLVASALVAAATHLIRWMRRTLRGLAQYRVPFFPTAALVPTRVPATRAPYASERLRTRGPPSLAVPR